MMMIKMMIDNDDGDDEVDDDDNIYIVRVIGTALSSGLMARFL